MFSPKRKSHIILTLLTILSLWSCKTKIENTDLNVGDDKIFFQGFLNPIATQITISISVAKGAADYGIKIPDNILPGSIVKINTGGVTKQLTYQSTQNRTAYFAIDASEIPIVPGQTYEVTVANGSFYSLQASTTIPQVDFNFDYEVSAPVSISGSTFRKVKTIIDDRKGTVNYYRLTFDNPVEPSMYNYESYQSDNDDKSNPVIITTEVDEYIYSSGEFKIHVSSITEDAYLYMIKIESILNGSGNPFAEPSALHSNVKGGLGVLGSMTTVSQDFKE